MVIVHDYTIWSSTYCFRIQITGQSHGKFVEFLQHCRYMFIKLSIANWYIYKWKVPLCFSMPQIVGVFFQVAWYCQCHAVVLRNGPLGRYNLPVCIGPLSCLYSVYLSLCSMFKQLLHNEKFDFNHTNSLPTW